MKCLRIILPILALLSLVTTSVVLDCGPNKMLKVTKSNILYKVLSREPTTFPNDKDENPTTLKLDLSTFILSVEQGEEKKECQINLGRNLENLKAVIKKVKNNQHAYSFQIINPNVLCKKRDGSKKHVLVITLRGNDYKEQDD